MLVFVAAIAGAVLTWAVLSAVGSPAPSGSAARPATGSSGGTSGVIERVVDGDTVVVALDGRRERVRLLNINTPETVAENKPVECLGPEASAFTKGLLPSGAPVRLAYDVERKDQYGRLLAAVYTADGRNVSVEVARQGLAFAVTFGANRRFRPVVQAAMEEAKRAQRGLFDPRGPCPH